ncbi:MAG TPA: hypothetical protein DET40_10925 [Lentisphaeria bacterium]|nr:MAG: hypothetical protein A2X45_11410 [Lentisphaerae bacterium GWF2_50_93]HCE44050.1 hypothetical protein [Lentisphaeria bacterium]
MKIFVRAFILGVTLQAFSALGVELLKNGDFENDMSAWRITDWKQKTGVLAVDSAVFSSGKKSFKLTNDSFEQTTMLEQDVPLAPKKKYTLKFKIKTDSVVPQPGTNGAGAAVMILNAGKQVVEVSPAGSWKQVTGTNDWQDCAVEFSPESINGGSKIYLVLRKATGTAYFDAVSLDGPAPEPPKLKAEMFPAGYQGNSYNLCENYPGVLLLDIMGPRQKTIDLILDVPEEMIGYVGSSPFYSTPKGEWLPDQCKVENVMRGDMKYLRHTISLQNQMISNIPPASFAWCNFDRVYIKASPGNIGKKAEIFWRLAGSTSGTDECKIIVNILPPIPVADKKLDKFKLMMCYLWSINSPFPEVSAAYSDFWLRLHARPMTLPVFGFQKMSIESREDLLKKFQVEIFVGSNQHLPSLGGFKHDVPWDCNESGKVLKGVPCPVYAEKDPEGLIWDNYYKQGVEGKLQEVPSATMLVYDLEPGFNAGYSQASRDAFAGELGLAQAPSISEIKKQYKDKWFDFRVRQQGRILTKMTEAHRKYFPNLKFVLCTDVLHSNGPVLSSWCGVDCRLSDNAVDSYMNMPYYEGLRYFDDVAFNSANLKKPQLHLINPSEKIRQCYAAYTPAGVMQNMLVNAMNGCTGIGFWAGDAFDGAYLTSIAVGARSIARVEDCITGTRCDPELQVSPVNASKVPVKSEDGKDIEIIYPDVSVTLKSSLHRSADGKSYAILLINYAPKAVIARVAIPAYKLGNCEIANALTGEKIEGASPELIRSGFLAEIPGKGAVVFKINNIDFQCVPAKEEQKIIAGKNPASDANSSELEQLKQESSKNSSVSWGIVPGTEKTLAIKLQMDEAKAYVSVERGANLVSWVYGGTDVLRYGKLRGYLGELVLYDPAQPAAPYQFSIKDSGVAEAGPFAMHSYLVQGYDGANPKPNPLYGLRIERKISLEENGAALRISFAFTNESPSKVDMKFGCRVKNIPYLGSDISGDKTPSEITVIKNNNVESDKAKNEKIFLASGATIPFGTNLKAEQWDSSTPFEVSASTPAKTEKMLLRMEPDKIGAGLYSWSGRGLYTLEALSGEMSVPYGSTQKWDIVFKLEMK